MSTDDFHSATEARCLITSLCNPSYSCAVCLTLVRFILLLFSLYHVSEIYPTLVQFVLLLAVCRFISKVRLAHAPVVKAP